MTEPVTLEFLARQLDLILLQMQQARREDREMQDRLREMEERLRAYIKRMC